MLTCGLPGSGKTTLAQQLAAARSALRLTKDEWLIALGSTPWDEPTRVKIEHELWHLAQHVLRLGLSVVLDFGLWARTERDEFRAAAVALASASNCTTSTYRPTSSWRRIDTRNAEPPWDSHPISRTHLDEWAAQFQAPDAAELALFDPPPRSD